jgi:FixJ family two-component response regulator
MESFSPTLFVVDDEPAARASTAAIGSSLGLNCETYSSAEEFLSHFDSSRPGCLILDLKLAGMDGIELQERLLARGSTLPVILVSGYGTVPVAVRAMQNGAITVLEKPCAAGELEKAIAVAIEINRQTQTNRSKQADLKARLEKLSPREREAMELIIAGQPNKSIARELGVSPRTVDRIRAAIFHKLDAASPMDLARMAVDSGTHAASNGNGNGDVLDDVPPVGQTVS